MTTIERPKTIFFFTYGTLRKGQALHNWLDGCIVTELGLARIPRTRLYFSRHHDGYPYLVKYEPNAAAIGEVYELELNDQIIGMLEMEMGAGYTIEEMSAELLDPDLEDFDDFNVVVCTWGNDNLLGRPVPNNDWCSPERMDWWT